VKKYYLILLNIVSIAPGYAAFSQANTIQDANKRDFEKNIVESVKETYKENHTQQTVAFVLQKEQQYIGTCRKKFTMWEVAELMKTFTDASDPDLTRPQIIHALQVGEAMRKDKLPRAWILAGFIHDFGKILYYFGEPQWAVVGDTFPVGCAFSDAIVYPEYFKDNPDFFDIRFNSRFGIYQPHCGLSNVHMSWGHDEYLYHKVKDRLPEEVCYAIRYHSFYPYHEKGAYEHLTNDYDKKMLKWINLLNKYDLYTKDDSPMDIEALLPYYKKLVEEFFPEPLNW